MRIRKQLKAVSYNDRVRGIRNPEEVPRYRRANHRREERIGVERRKSQRKKESSFRFVSSLSEGPNAGKSTLGIGWWGRKIAIVLRNRKRRGNRIGDCDQAQGADRFYRYAVCMKPIRLWGGR